MLLCFVIAILLTVNKRVHGAHFSETTVAIIHVCIVVCRPATTTTTMTTQQDDSFVLYRSPKPQLPRKHALDYDRLEAVKAAWVKGAMLEDSQTRRDVYTIGVRVVNLDKQFNTNTNAFTSFEAKAKTFKRVSLFCHDLNGRVCQIYTLSQNEEAPTV